MGDPVNTSKVVGRRQLRFNSLDDILADVDGLASAQKLRTLGNWPAGQILQHVATVMNKSIDGFTHRPSAPVRFLIRLLFKRRFLTRPMPAGFKLPAAAQAELAAPADFDQGLHSIRAAIHRLKSESKRVPHPVLGPLSPAEWEQAQCRHSELHLSFLVPADV